MFFRPPARSDIARPHVRPWALAGPVLVLLVAAPLLRPLRHPDPTAVSDDEACRLATMAAVVEHHTLALDGLDLGPTPSPPARGLIRYRGRTFSAQPPVMAALLAGPYWLLSQLNLTLRTSPVLVPFLLTLIGVTLPVAGAAGLVYKMGRLFELSRPWRAVLGAAVVFGSGLVSYAVVLAPHAPAATLVLAAAGLMVYLAYSRQPGRRVGWLAVAGACAALAAVLDPPAAVYPLLLLTVILAMRWPSARRAMGVALFTLGALPPLLLHLALTQRTTGDWRPGFLHPELAMARPNPAGAKARGRVANPGSAVAADEDAEDEPTGWRASARPVWRVFGCLLGGHGLLPHFPVLILSAFGVAAVMHRNWPAATKVLAFTSVTGAAAVVLVYAFRTVDGRAPGGSSAGAMFANRWFVSFMPLMVFWGGAWLRRPHRPAAWAAAAGLLAYSVAVSLVGATDPLPRNGYDHFTAADAAQRLFESPADPSITPLASGGC